MLAVKNTPYDASLREKPSYVIDKTVPCAAFQGLLVPLQKSLIMKPIADCHAALLIKEDCLFATFFPINQADMMINSIQDNMEDTNRILLFAANSPLSKHDSARFIQSVEDLFKGTKTECTAIYPNDFSNPNGDFRSSVVATKGKVYLNGCHIVSEYKYT